MPKNELAAYKIKYCSLNRDSIFVYFAFALQIGRNRYGMYFRRTIENSIPATASNFPFYCLQGFRRIARLPSLRFITGLGTFYICCSATLPLCHCPSSKLFPDYTFPLIFNEMCRLFLSTEHGVLSDRIRSILHSDTTIHPKENRYEKTNLPPGFSEVPAHRRRRCRLRFN